MKEWNSWLMGANFRDPSAKEVVKALAIGEQLTLKRDPENQFDPNAIQVWAGDTWIGFIERGLAEELAPLMDAGTEYDCEVSGFGTNPLKPFLDGKER